MSNIEQDALESNLLPLIDNMRILFRIAGGKIDGIQEVESGSYVINQANMHDVLAMMVPGKMLVDRPPGYVQE